MLRADKNRTQLTDLRDIISEVKQLNERSENAVFPTVARLGTC